MYLLAFYAFLRIGEITIKNGYSAHCIRRDNIVFIFDDDHHKPSGFELSFHSFKHSTGKSKPTLLIKSIQQPEFCPVDSLFKYCNLRDDSPGPLFMFMDGSPVTYNYFNQHLQLSLKWANLDCKVYKGHSFRIGAATTAAALGISDENIQIMGRWHSNAFKKYIRIPSITLPPYANNK
ncbi:hypothetical protein FSP39_009797 [Pinctada imbricata]|uniref:Tyr recombinase domain-containing protein n=2 Tax=Pinctada imbricata TaxID=66713 RepID=A0AA88YND3_PINIB|nr:hypothetical protein FSP39_009797 [Pinctada imbricata]